MVLHDQNSGLYDSGDDWLKKEIDRERNMSAWELDGREAARLAHEKHCEAETVRSLHQQNCDVRQVAAEHASVHRGSIPPVTAPSPAFSAGTMQFHRNVLDRLFRDHPRECNQHDLRILRRSLLRNLALLFLYIHTDYHSQCYF